MATVKLYTAIARAVGAAIRCEIPGASCAEWGPKHRARIDALVRERCPSGSGFNNGTKFDHDRSRPDRLILRTAFHHMDENGFYDGWTEHDVIVTPSLEFGYAIRVTGRNQLNIKDYIADLFHYIGSCEISEY